MNENSVVATRTESFRRPNGIRISYRYTPAAAHAANQAPIFLLHGTFQSARIWESIGVTDALRGDRPLIEVDMLGHGASDKPVDPQDYLIEALAHDLLGIADELGFERFHTVGFSLGARTSLRIPFIAPGRLESMVCVGGSHRPQPSLADRVFFPGARAALDSGSMDVFMDQWDAQRERPLSAASRDRLRTNEPGALAAFFDSQELDSGREIDDYAAVFTPALFLVGEHDSERLADSWLLAGTMPAGYFSVLEDADHSASIRAAAPEILRHFDALELASAA
ncbi:Alpha/beta hydrolase fold protein OS=Tsukamurella paurometabola (strain ATCC 8368 / DSM / CCUG 35730 / CIP 100753 / JCM 10117 / KCTC 9821 / NBRC 16120 /NCIMB 702349 / NCTC 13040) OX=521096 GN=Tpau_4026 PE=4 SV=1 [Tsukamurella paurometabola]|uniref:Alpha/beta hydrolase fold protein n=1 Tax=Tsukamurella paurometabola (strain ATCC 8368 / DSM 20162 / CCUG 35730 / CIP 100753 / JCM 10117 / KCTC 9821 / NBRC 16120 / NCIMB 702349 / NCTC 13040) TaxID=521096 RepID=D5UNA2_TSUPD|nr:alpha/beta fold hydrolase [Tsukamurella paurometabola]ADG80597.1 alpha/beta hydrolase fold protein [Tsukamurella paurometabola DSM 20162]SUP40228.1 Haloacetate dehalogenase H-1 [Tsukamurella paurometabola]